MFKQERSEALFDWSMLGDVSEGRPNLGLTTDVSVYRLMQFTLRDAMIKKFGVDVADHLFYDAGKTAGTHLYERLIKTRDGFHPLMEELQDILKQLKIGILRVEKADLEQMHFTITVAEDLDCSGLPVCDEMICTYDEGFLAGILESHLHREFAVKEVDCWCSGDRVCRFEAKAV